MNGVGSKSKEKMDLQSGSVDTQLKKKRQRFFKAGEPLFIRFGYRKTTIEDICQAAGMSKRTFYDLFRDKSDLYTRMSLYICENLIEKWQHELPSEMDAPTKIASFIDYYVTVIVQRPLFRILLQDKETLSAFWELGQELTDSPVIDTMREIISQGRVSGCFREQDTDNAVWMIISLLDSMYLLMPVMLKQPPGVQETGLKEEVKSFILHGLGAGNETH